MFGISVLFVLLSSYLILSVINKKSERTGFLYFLLISFSQIILSFEILSLFKMISEIGFLLCNTAVLTVSGVIFIKTKSVFYKPEIKDELKKIQFALKHDWILMFLSFCFLIFLILQAVKSLYFPITFGDALTYYLSRCTSWIQNGSISHFLTPDSRELIMPVNMEFLYTWLMLFTKSGKCCSIFSFISFIGAIYIIYNFLREINFTLRRSLWSVFVFSSFALVSIEMYMPCSDLAAGALILGCVFLFLKSAKYNDNKALYFSSLSYALAMGTKTTAIIALPSVLAILILILLIYKKEKIFKYILEFSALFLVNFIVFSSYNYILNAIQFLNPISNSEQLLLNQFRGGFKGWYCNFIKYIFLIFDISGIKDFINFNGFITYIQSLFLALAGSTDKSYTSAYFNRYFYFNCDMSIINSALGVTGLFAFLPSIIKSLKKYFNNKARIKYSILSVLTLSLILNIIIFSGTMIFTQYNARYLLTFVVIASPVCVYSYIKSNKKFVKILLSIFIFIYFIIIPVNSFQVLPAQNSDENNIYNYIKKQNPPKKIGLIISQNRTPNYYIEKLKLNKFYIEKISIENIEEYNLSEYDYIITNKYKTSSTNILQFENRINYPSMFINSCVYYDYRQSVIYNTNKKPAMVECEIPLDYIILNGFKYDENINLNNYFILKRN